MIEPIKYLVDIEIQISKHAAIKSRSSLAACRWRFQYKFYPMSTATFRNLNPNGYKCKVAKLQFHYSAVGFSLTREFGISLICPLREPFTEKNTFSFGHCPNHPNPSPLHAILLTFSLFFRPQNKKGQNKLGQTPPGNAQKNGWFFWEGLPTMQYKCVSLFRDSSLNLGTSRRRLHAYKKGPFLLIHASTSWALITLWVVRPNVLNNTSERSAYGEKVDWFGDSLLQNN